MKTFKIHANNFEDTWVKLILNNTSTLIVDSVYRYSKQNFDPFKDEFIKSLKAETKYFISGDFNIDCQKYNQNANVTKYTNYIQKSRVIKLLLNTRVKKQKYCKP